MLGRGRREERREERQTERATFGARGNAEHFKMCEKMLSIGDDFWIESEAGRRAYKVNGKALRLRKTMILEDPAGNELAKVQDRPVRVRQVMEVENPGGGTAATVKKAMITPVRERYTVQLAGAAEMEVKGNIVDHEYTIESNGTKVAEVSKKWFRVRDTYGVEVDPSQNTALMLAVTVCIDTMSH